ncbi:MAG: undecaprenyldiphospho-muramoylpentapeptide beta-N-acetylglucosaminyltransferase [Actinomycetota bacterium]|nr:undecaprenyldiphospho-muramoylpentapeptide beta-N-acetylglucosaminyltransferase [Actinomycetota bacterium]
MRVVITGGGTAGHVHPAIALADALADEDVSFFGTATGAEARLVPQAGLPFSALDIRGFDRAKPFGLLPVAARAAGAVVQARSLLARFRPHVVVGMGGYVSLPVCIAARTQSIPVVLHEQNIVVGLANRVCKRFAIRVAVSWQATLAQAGSRGVFTGNPVLPEIADLDRDGRRSGALARFGLDASRRTLLVFGGSQGAHRINEAAAGLHERWSDRTDIQVLHLAGRSEFDALESRVATKGELVYKLVDFLPGMGDAYAVADLALCRGGATTIAELATTGLPAIIVPYPFHRDRQQQLLGEVLERAGAATLLRDADTTAASVGAAAERLFEGDGVLEAMAKAALTLGHPDAAQRLAAVVREAGS